MSHFNKLRSHRSFRIPVEEGDKISFQLYRGKDKESEQVKFVTLVNLSLTGLGFTTNEELAMGSIFCVSLSFRGTEFSLPAKLIRLNKINNEYGEVEHYICGLHFDVEEQDLSRRFIQKFISSFSTKRLKNHLINLVFNEGMVKSQTNKQKISLLENLYEDMRKFDELSDFAKMIFKETKRLIKADSFNFYLFRNEYQHISSVDFSKEEASGDLHHYGGSLIETVLTTKRAINTKISKAHPDAFYKYMKDYFDIDTSTVLLVPVFDDQESVMGVIEFSNKIGEDFFSREDMLHCEILSFTLTSIWKDFHKEPVKEDQLEFSESEDFILVGVSDFILETRRFVKSVKATNDNILITGEYGTGKKLLAQHIHSSSNRGSLGIGVLNCHDIISLSSLEFILNGAEEHVGLCELYSGGSIIIKDISYLNLELQKSLLTIIEQRKDIRFICTTPVSLEKLIQENDFDLNLYDYISKKKISVPPLRDRKEDIVSLTKFFLEKACKENGQYVKKIDEKIIKKFKDYNWPGNVQEVKTAVERIVLYNISKNYIDELPSVVTPVFDINYSQYNVFQEILKDIDPELIKKLDFKDLEDLYLTGLAESYFVSEFSQKEIAQIFQLDEQKLVERLFHGKELFRKYFGIDLEISYSEAS